MKHAFDEMCLDLNSDCAFSADATAPAAVRAHYRTYARWLQGQSASLMRARREEAEMIFRRVGITFAVYGAKDEDGSGTERLIPFDLIPRAIPRQEWNRMAAGLRQRVTALVTSRAIFSARPRFIDAVAATALRSSSVKPSRLPARLIWWRAVHAPDGL